MPNTIEEIANVLEMKGYEFRSMALTSSQKWVVKQIHYTAVLHLSDAKLNITCELAKLGEFSEDNLSLFSFPSTLCKHSVDPYAFAIIDSSDDPEIENAEDFTLVPHRHSADR